MNVFSALKQAKNRWDKGLALWSSKAKFDFEGLFEAVLNFAAQLQKAGFEKGDKFFVWSFNHPAAAVGILAAWVLEGIVVPLDASTKPEDVVGLINHAQGRFLLTAPRQKEFLNRILEASSLKRVFILEDVFKSPTSGAVSLPGHEELAPALILYTSGSTGTPKGVVLTYRHLDSPMLTLEHFQYLQPGDRLLGLAPFSHLGGVVGLLIPVWFGVPVFLMERFIPKLFLRYLGQHQITFFFVPPTVLQSLLLQPDLDPKLFKSVRLIASFGAPCPPTIFKAFSERLPWINVVTGYGLSESAAPNVLIPKDTPLEKKLEPGIVGKPVPWVEIKIVNDEGKGLTQGEIGEVLLKGWCVMQGYYNAPELTREAIKDGWLYTGDLGFLDKEGFLHLTGRKKEVIIVGGLNVYANEVEFVIARHPKVAEVAVVGVPDGLRGEVVKAVIVPKPGVSLDSQEILNFCRTYLASYKLPRIIELRPFLPKTASGKIAKAQLK